MTFLCSRAAQGAICVEARVPRGTDRTDRGDSGGPMTTTVNGQLRQIGVVSGIWSTNGESMYTFYAVQDRCDWLRN